MALPTLLLHEYLSHIHRQSYTWSGTSVSSASAFEDGWLYLTAWDISRSFVHTIPGFGFSESSIQLDRLQYSAQIASGPEGMGYRVALRIRPMLGEKRFEAATRLFSHCPISGDPSSSYADQCILELNRQLQVPHFREETLLSTVSRWLQRVGEDLFAAGRFREGTEAFILASDVDPVHPDEALAQLGNCYFEEGNLDAAAEQYSRALVLNRWNWVAILGRSHVAYRRGDVTTALSLVEEAIEIAPDQSQLWNHKGVLLLSAKDCTRAIEAFDRSLAIDPGYRDAARNKYDALRRCGRNDEAARLRQQFQL
jgi:tetratricopeptide (TPR) repeat protein